MRRKNKILCDGDGCGVQVEELTDYGMQEIKKLPKNICTGLLCSECEKKK